MSDNSALLVGPSQDAAHFRAAPRPWRTGLIYAAALLVSALCALLSHRVAYFAWDVEVTRALQSFGSPAFDALMRAASYFGNPPKMVAVSALALIVAHRRREALYLSASGLGSWLIYTALKELVARPRPTPELVEVFRQLPDASFPSGHVMFYVCFFGFLSCVAGRRLRRARRVRVAVHGLLGLLVVLVGVSRVYLGEHWPSDLVGSYVLAGTWLAVVSHFYVRRPAAHARKA